MKNLPAISKNPLCIAEEHNENSEYRQHIQKLEVELEGVHKNIESIREGVEVTLKSLSDSHIFVSVYEDFLELIARIELAVKEGTDQERFQQKMDDINAYSDLNKEQREEFNSSKRKKKIKCSEATKRLFIRISNLVHPDKSKLPNASELFNHAYSLYKNNDTHGLEALYASIVAADYTIPLSKDSLEAVIDSLRKKLSDAALALEAIKDSPQYVIHEEFSSYTEDQFLVASANVVDLIKRGYTNMMTSYFPEEPNKYAKKKTYTFFSFT